MLNNIVTMAQRRRLHKWFFYATDTNKMTFLQKNSTNKSNKAPHLFSNVVPIIKNQIK